MNVTLIYLTLLFMTNGILFDFTPQADVSNWRMVNDGVMGGRSQSLFSLNENGHGLFQGRVSLENNGGFASVRYRFATLNSSEYDQIKIRLKGDGKTYQFRIKASSEQRYSYISEIQTSRDWEVFTIDFSNMYAAFRGRLLDIPNYSGEKMSEVAFLIGNKKEEGFSLEIDSIRLK